MSGLSVVCILSVDTCKVQMNERGAVGISLEGNVSNVTMIVVMMVIDDSSCEQ